LIRGFSWRNPWHVLACGFGTGLAPKAPGTFGTLVGLPIYAALHGAPLGTYVAVVGALAIFGVYVCEQAGRDFDVPDHPGNVFDEVVGYLVTMIAAPSGWEWAVVGFVLFRVFDITKPWPVSVADRRLHGGLGVMLDDLLAGVYSALALQLIWHVSVLAQRL